MFPSFVSKSHISVKIEGNSRKWVTFLFDKIHRHLPIMADMTLGRTGGLGDVSEAVVSLGNWRNSRNSKTFLTCVTVQ